MGEAVGHGQWQHQWGRVGYVKLPRCVGQTASTETTMHRIPERKIGVCATALRVDMSTPTHPHTTHPHTTHPHTTHPHTTHPHCTSCVRCKQTSLDSISPLPPTVIVFTHLLPQNMFLNKQWFNRGSTNNAVRKTAKLN